MIRNLSFVLALAFLVTACQEDTGYEISGNVNNAAEGQNILVAQLDETTNQPKVIDTVQVTEGKFSLDLPEVKKPTISFLQLEGTRGSVMYIAENQPISFEIYPDSIFTSKVKGGADNEILMDYAASMVASQQEMQTIRNTMMEAFSTQDTLGITNAQKEQDVVIGKMKKEKKELVENHPNSIVSVIVMQEMVGTKMFPTSELQSLYDNLSSDLKSTSLGKKIGEALSNLSSVEIGNKAPSFTAPNPEGEQIALEDVLGKVTLIDFWASWCKPCRVENPNIVRVYEKYHDKGFNAIGVSLDREGQRDKWIQAIAEDNLSWPQVSNLQFWQDPVAQQYGIQSIPAAFLLDENGVIVARNLRGEALEQKVAELLGEE